MARLPFRFFAFWALLSLTFLLFSSVVFPACSGELTHPLVAVVGKSGGFVNVTVKATPGSGKEYIGIFPYAGVSTQQSIKYAINYARTISENDDENCDVLVSFSELPSGDYIDGPSAGAAIAVLSYALFENASIRNDTIITGTIQPDGTIGAVGGLYEKAKASAENGMRYFITPFNNVYEFITLKKVSKKYNIEILQTDTINKIIDFMLYNKTISERETPTFQSRISENTAPLPISEQKKLTDFKDIAYRMIELENYSLNNMPRNSDTAWINTYFSEVIEEQSDIIDLGYYFTAANDAFLNYIEISTINAVFADDIDLQGKRNEVVDCLSSIQRPEMKTTNLEWVVGSDLRTGWATDKLNSTEISDNLLVEEKYAVYNSLMYADAWCYVAKSLAKVAERNSDGQRINESAWKELAERKIAEAEKLEHSDDTKSHFAIAKKLYSSELYGAAIVEATYVNAMDTAELDLLSMSDDELNNALSVLSNESRKSLWGNVYRSQALFMLNKKNPDKGTAYRLFVYAQKLDNSFEEMEEEMVIVPDEKNAVNGEGREGEGSPFLHPCLGAALIFLLVSFVVLFILPKILGRSYGSNDKRYRRGFRTGKEKIRTRTQKSASSGTSRGHE